MTETINRILEDSPVVVKEDWLPADTEFDALNELATEHRETLADLRDISAQIHALRAKYQQEDDAALEAQRRAYATGEDAQIPKRTANSAREKAMQELSERGLVAQEHLAEVASEVIATCQANLDAWSDTLRSHEREAQGRVAELRQQLQTVEAEAAQAPDLRVWLERTARGKPGQLVHWGWWQHEKPTQDLLQIANESRSKYNSIASAALRTELNGGGVDTDTTGVPTYEDEVADYSSPEYQATLERNLQRHVAQRRPGDNTPGGL